MECVDGRTSGEIALEELAPQNAGCETFLELVGASDHGCGPTAARGTLTGMRDYPLVGCGHCGLGIVAHDAPQCPFQPHALCEPCAEDCARFVAAMEAQGFDPFATRRRGRRGKSQHGVARPLL